MSSVSPKSRFPLSPLSPRHNVVLPIGHKRCASAHRSASAVSSRSNSIEHNTGLKIITDTAVQRKVAEIQKLREQNAKLSTQLEQSRAEAAEVEELVVDLSKKLADAEEIAKQHVVRCLVRELRQKETSTTFHNLRRNHWVSKQEALNTQLILDRKDAKAREAQATRMCLDLEKEVKRLTNRDDALAAERAELAAQTAAEASERELALTKEVEALGGSVEEAVAGKQYATALVAVHKAEITRLEAALEEKDQCGKELGEALEERKALKAQLEESQQTTIRLEAELQDASQKATERSEEATQLRVRLRELQEASQNHEEVWAEQLEQAVQAQKEAERQCIAAVSVADAAKASGHMHATKAAGRETLLCELETSLAEKDEALRELRSQAALDQAALREATGERARAETERDVAVGALRASQEDHARVCSRVASLESEQVSIMDAAIDREEAWRRMEAQLVEKDKALTQSTTALAEMAVALERSLDAKRLAEESQCASRDTMTQRLREAEQRETELKERCAALEAEMQHRTAAAPAHVKDRDSDADGSCRRSQDERKRVTAGTDQQDYHPPADWFNSGTGVQKRPQYDRRAPIGAGQQQAAEKQEDLHRRLTNINKSASVLAEATIQHGTLLQSTSVSTNSKMHDPNPAMRTAHATTAAKKVPTATGSCRGADGKKVAASPYNIEPRSLRPRSPEKRRRSKPPQDYPRRPASGGAVRGTQ